MPSKSEYKRKAFLKLVELGVRGIKPDFTIKDVHRAADGQLVVIVSVGVLKKHDDQEKALESLSVMVGRATWYMREHDSNVILNQTVSRPFRQADAPLEGPMIRFGGKMMSQVGRQSQYRVTMRNKIRRGDPGNLLGSIQFDFVSHPAPTSALSGSAISHRTPPSPRRRLQSCPGRIRLSKEALKAPAHSQQEEKNNEVDDPVEPASRENKDDDEALEHLRNPAPMKEEDDDMELPSKESMRKRSSSESSIRELESQASTKYVTVCLLHSAPIFKNAPFPPRSPYSSTCESDDSSDELVDDLFESDVSGPIAASSLYARIEPSPLKRPIEEDEPVAPKKPRVVKRVHKFSLVNVYSTLPKQAQELAEKLGELNILPPNSNFFKLPTLNFYRLCYNFSVLSDSDSRKVKEKIDEMTWHQKFYVSAFQEPKPEPFFCVGTVDGKQFVRAVLLATHLIDSGRVPTVAMGKAVEDWNMLEDALRSKEVVKKVEAALTKPGRVFLTEIKQEARRKTAAK